MCSDRVTTTGAPVPIGGPRPVGPPAPAQTIARTDTGHIRQAQEWEIKATESRTVFLKLAGDNNTFAQKHLLSPSAKHADDTEKLKRRVWHRVDKGATKDANPYKDEGAKATGTGAMSRAAKYGDSLALKTRSKRDKPLTQVANSAIMLGIHDLESVLTEMSQALLARGLAAGTTKAEVEVTFSKPCVMTADAAGNVSEAVSRVLVHADCITHDGDRSSFEITHLEPASDD